MLTLTFLGTSAGMPTKHRNVTALAVSLINLYSKAKNVPWILVDCGEATQHQLLKTPLSVMQLELLWLARVTGKYGDEWAQASINPYRSTSHCRLSCSRASHDSADDKF